MKILLYPLVLLGIAAHALAAETPGDRWNLGDIYPSLQAWNDDAAKLESQLKDFAPACRGHLGESAAKLRQCLDLNADIDKRYSRLAVYSNELAAEDTGAAAGLELRQRSQVLGSRIGEATAFMSPELIALGKEKVDALMGRERSLSIYRQPIDQVLRMAPHTLDAKGEAIVATFGLATGAAGSTYRVLSGADLPWPTVRLSDGKEVKLDQSAYSHYREADNRDDRKKVFDAFWGTWKEFERTFGVTFYENLKKDTAYAKVRGYPDSITQSLDRNRVPVAVYDELIAQANANLPTLHRYFRLRAKMLGVSGMRYYDIYPPLVTGGAQYPIEQGKAMMLEAVKPLGEPYRDAMAAGVKSRWMDAYPRPRKQSGAHMAGRAYDVHPYVLMNYTDNYESVSTMAHEWGHAMHSYLSNRGQPFVTSGYSIFVAEIASTFNEALLLDSVLKGAKSDGERLLYLGSALEGLRATFFRQAMFAEFERDVHARVDKGESLTGEKLTKIYGEILRRYHGEKDGVVKIDDLYTVEWAFIPHFYSSFYVYQYATSIAASSLFAESVLKGEPGARERYLKLLGAGSSDYPYDLVKAAGVDLASPAPYQAVAARMNRIMDEIEAIQARGGGLSGTVGSREEGPMEGVLVSAQREGSPITVTVVSDDQGRFRFPAGRLAPGPHAIRIRATGFELEGPPTVTIDAAKAANIDVKLKPAADLASQLTNAEWMASVPGSASDKRALLNCVACHTLERVVRSKYSAEDFLNVVLPRMQGYVNQSMPGAPQLRKGERLMEERGDQRVQIYRELGEFLANINQSKGPWTYALKTFPRPKGEATKVVYTEWDLPRRLAQPHDVIVDGRGHAWYSAFGDQKIGRVDLATGAVKEFDIAISKPEFPTGVLALRADRDGILWFGNMYQASIGRFDPATEKVRYFAPPPEDNLASTQLNQVSPFSAAVDGKVWAQNSGFAGVHRFDLATGKVETWAPFRDSKEPHNIYDVIADSRNNAFFTDFRQSHIGRIDAKTGEVRLYQTPTKGSSPRRGSMDAQDRLWFGEYRGHNIGMLDTKTGAIREWTPPTPYSAPYDVALDRTGHAWTGSMTTDRIARLDTASGKFVEYLLPRSTNVRRVFVEDATDPPTLWVGNNHGASIVKVEAFAP
ncbi:MAG: oligoendopeptidase F [Usitatibacter sp.]